MRFRRHTLPAATRQAIPTASGNRILASAELADGAWVIAQRGSIAVAEGDSIQLSRPWCDVDRAAFDPETTTVTLTWVDDEKPLVATLAESRHLNLVRTVRERVESSVILSETVTFSGGRTARVAVRRDASDHLFSQVIAEAGVNLNDPETLGKVDAAEARVRSAAGLPR